MINETILAARALSHNEVHNVVGDNTEPVIPKTKPTVKSLANENHFIFLNMMPINKDKMIGIKNQIITSLYSIFAYNVAANRRTAFWCVLVEPLCYVIFYNKPSLARVKLI